MTPFSRRIRTTPDFPSPILATQLSERRRASISPEVRLAIAVLEDAVQSVTVPHDKRRAASALEFSRARDWILDDSREWPFSFANLCEQLGLDVDAVRESLGMCARVEVEDAPLRQIG